ncbi:MAG TPA: hypothetical protein VN028_08375 [Rhodocyclaceae bacterium]|nr:hypothetical protein [Rhodocyclaceae bacterium]
MKTLTIRLACIVVIGGLAMGLARAQNVSQHSGLLTDSNGRALYTFDKDSAGKSQCSGACLAAWPAFAAKAGDKPAAAYSTLTRDDGSLQWARNGKLLYYYVGDSKPGEANGDDQGGVWHVVKVGTSAKAAPAPAPISTHSGY